MTTSEPLSAQAEAGNVFVLRGPWNDAWFAELEAFPEGKHDDRVDSTSRAFNHLVSQPMPQTPIGPKVFTNG